MRIKNTLIATNGLMIVTILSGVVLASSTVSAETTTVDDVTFLVPAACTLSATGSTLHSATINPGTYTADIGTTTLKAVCNDGAGFAIYATGYTGDIIGETNSNKLVGDTTNLTIATGTATSGSTSNWAMKLGTNANATYPITIENSFDTYQAVPNEYTKVASRATATDGGDSAVGSVLTTTYAVFVASTQSADTYEGKVIYTLVHPASHAAPVACNPSATTIAQTKCMQDFTGAGHDAIIASMTTGTQYTIKDSRDGKTYTIAKLADGNVWMTQNLDHDIVAGTTYTNEDTDIGYNTTTGVYDAAAWMPIRSTYATNASGTGQWCQGGIWNSEYHYCEVNDTPESYDPGNKYWNAIISDYSDWNDYYGSCDYSTSTPVCDESLNPLSTYTSSTGTAQYHLGNYYNWAAALATNDSSVYDDDDLVEQSICPAGWTLPRIGTGEDTFYALWDAYNMASESFIDADSDGVYDSNEIALWTSPLYFTASGVYDGALNDVGDDGFFWSPVADYSSGARYAGYSVDGGAGPSNGYDRSYGFSIRCVARPVVSSASEGGGDGPDPGPEGPNF